MKLHVTNDETIWRYHVKDCKIMVSVLKRALRFKYCWTEELTSIKWCKKQLHLNENATVDWNSYMRKVCSLDLI